MDAEPLGQAQFSVVPAGHVRITDQMFINVQFGKAVRLRRRKLGWSQEKLAEHAGLHWTYIGRIERGKQNISLANVGKICKALRTTVEKMFKGIR